MVIISYAGIMDGISARLASVECMVSRGLPQFRIIGMPSASVRESKDRVMSAIRSSGFSMPKGRILVSLSPSDIRKSGTHFDLAIALGLVSFSGGGGGSALGDIVALGELSLEGDVVMTQNIVPIIIGLMEKGHTRFMVPSRNKDELTGFDMESFIFVSTLSEAWSALSSPGNRTSRGILGAPVGDVTESGLLFEDVEGCFQMKRALEISVCGRHHMLIVGEPGIGKSMLLRRVGSIAPSLDDKQAMAVCRIHRLMGISRRPDDMRQPVRCPGYLSSLDKFLGVQSSLLPGEVTLSSGGILVLDELAEFKTSVLDTLRLLIDKKTLTFRKRDALYEFPCDFLLIASSNPCKCGMSGSDKPCVCTRSELESYRSKFGAPLMDRIDIKLFAHRIDKNSGEFGDAYDMYMEEFSSAKVKARIEKAMVMQRRRNQEFGISFNSEIGEEIMSRAIGLDDETKGYLRDLIKSERMSKRSRDSILRVARTIADLDGSEHVKFDHVCESYFLNTRMFEKRQSQPSGAMKGVSGVIEK